MLSSLLPPRLLEPDPSCTFRAPSSSRSHHTTTAPKVCRAEMSCISADDTSHTNSDRSNDQRREARSRSGQPLGQRTRPKPREEALRPGQPSMGARVSQQEEAAAEVACRKWIRGISQGAIANREDRRWMRRDRVV